MLKRIATILGVSLVELPDYGIISTRRIISTYQRKPSEYIYIQSDDKKISEYSEHPKHGPIISIKHQGLFILIPKLKAKGCSNKTINYIVDLILSYNKAKSLPTKSRKRKKISN